MRGSFCAVVAAILLNAAEGGAQDRQPDTQTTFAFRTSIKATGLLSRAPEDSDLFTDRSSADSLFRLRLEPEVRVGARAVLTVAYEQRLQLSSGAGGITTIAILPPQVAAPYRIRALDWTMSESPGTTWRQEIDRASVQVHFPRADLTVGRQALGWGRGVIFSAVDFFAPFSPLEADREWRRGIDAVRADFKLTDRSSVDVVGAFGSTLNASAFGARFRGYARSLDIEMVGGRRARDLFGGITTSAPIGQAEVHGELALFHLPAPVVPGASDIVWKATVGGSYRFPIGSGIVAFAEYHYSGFGAERPELILPLLSTPAYLERYLRGDTQILSRHAVAVTGSYEASPEFTYGGQWLHNPADGSGIVAPTLTYTLNNTVSLFGAAYLPYGAPPQGVSLKSEYGVVSLSALLQLRVYL